MAQHKSFIDTERSPKINLAPGINARILVGDDNEQMMMVLTTVDPGVTVPAHSHPHEQMGMVYSGKARLKIGDEVRELVKGEFCYFPPDVEHEATCLGDEPFTMLDIFYPIREDFIDKIKQNQ